MSRRETSAKCAKCIFYYNLDAEEGECRKSAPRLRFARDGNADEAVWPPVSANDWCGEFTPDLQIDLPLDVKESQKHDNERYTTVISEYHGR